MAHRALRCTPYGKGKTELQTLSWSNSNLEISACRSGNFRPTIDVSSLDTLSKNCTFSKRPFKTDENFSTNQTRPERLKRSKQKFLKVVDNWTNKWESVGVINPSQFWYLFVADKSKWIIEIYFSCFPCVLGKYHQLYESFGWKSSPESK